MKRLFRTPQLIWRTVSGDLEALWNHLLEDGWLGFVPWLNSRDAPATIQFLKYGVSGGLATFVNVAIVVVLGVTLLPVFPGLIGESIPDPVRETNMKIANLIAFPFANFAAYYLNVLWVFTPGRHSRWKEFWLFTLISAISFGAGMFGGPELIGWFGAPSWVAQAGFVVTAALVNFVCRKFLVFKG
ncbi:MAG: GtrA family protein [Verrucomicrobiales bacterium]